MVCRHGSLNKRSKLHSSLFYSTRIQPAHDIDPAEQKEWNGGRPPNENRLIQDQLGYTWILEIVQLMYASRETHSTEQMP